MAVNHPVIGPPTLKGKIASVIFRISASASKLFVWDINNIGPTTTSHLIIIYIAVSARQNPK